MTTFENSNHYHAAFGRSNGKTHIVSMWPEVTIIDRTLNNYHEDTDRSSNYHHVIGSYSWKYTTVGHVVSIRVVEFQRGTGESSYNDVIYVIRLIYCFITRLLHLFYVTQMYCGIVQHLASILLAYFGHSNRKQ